ncbi:MAG: hypothetical protein DGJ47_001041 [Rickettsiaceae bacterium]
MTSTIITTYTSKKMKDTIRIVFKQMRVGTDKYLETLQEFLESYPHTVVTNPQGETILHVLLKRGNTKDNKDFYKKCLNTCQKYDIDIEESYGAIGPVTKLLKKRHPDLYDNLYESKEEISNNTERSLIAPTLIDNNKGSALEFHGDVHEADMLLN